MKIEKYKEKAKLIRDNDTYKVYDLYHLQNLSLSLTELNPNKNTSGHSHDDADEVYIFVSGTGRLQIDDNSEDVEPGDIFTIPRGAFHKVYNTSDKEILTFWSIFEKYENRK